MEKPCKVLVIEDDAAARMTLTAFLEDSGYTVVEAGQGRRAMELFSRERPDIVLTDLRMPDMDGFVVIARLKEESPSTPVIVITGTGDDSAASEAVSLGASGFMMKPIHDMGELVALMESALRQKRGETPGLQPAAQEERWRKEKKY